LTEALECAQRAVKLDLAKSDLPLAVAAYDESIAVLQRVIARRSQKPGISSEVERVTGIHDRYAERVRELCRAHKIPLPSHVAPTPGGFSPSMITSPLPFLDPPQDPSPDTPLATHDTNPSPKFQHQSSLEDDETESESEPQLSRSPSTAPSTSETPLLTPADDYVLDGRQWMLSEAREEELEEWGQYLGEPAAANYRLSALTAAPPSAWSSMGKSHGEYVP